MAASPEPATRLEILDGNIALLTLDQPGSRANTLGQAVLGELEGRIREIGRPQRPDRPDPAQRQARHVHRRRRPQGTRRRQARRRYGPHAWSSAASTSSPPSRSCRSRPSPPSTAPAWAAAWSWPSASTTAWPASHPKTEIGLPEMKIGLIPGWGGTQRLTRLIGPSLAAEMICSGEPAKADRARQLGLVFDVVPSEQLLDEALRLLAMGASDRRLARSARERKQQPVGLSEEQLGFTFAVLRAQVLAKTGGQYPAAAGRARRHRQGLQPAAGRRAQGRDRGVRAAGRQSRSRAT